MPTTQTIPIDLNTRGANPVAFTHQGDTARAFAFEVYNNGEAFALTGYTAKIGAILPADRGYTVIAGNDMATGSVSENTITATLPAAYTAKAGHGLLTIILTGSGATIRPINVDFRIQKSADAPDTVAGASDFPLTLQGYAESVTLDWLDENADDWINSSGGQILETKANAWLGNDGVALVETTANDWLDTNADTKIQSKVNTWLNSNADSKIETKTNAWLNSNGETILETKATDWLEENVGTLTDRIAFIDKYIKLTPVDGTLTEGKLHRNSSNKIITWSGGYVRQVPVSENTDYYITTAAVINAEGFALVDYYGENNAYISSEYPLTPSQNVSLTTQKLTIPSNAVGFYINGINTVPKAYAYITPQIPLEEKLADINSFINSVKAKYNQSIASVLSCFSYMNYDPFFYQGAIDDATGATSSSTTSCYTDYLESESNAGFTINLPTSFVYSVYEYSYAGTGGYLGKVLSNESGVNHVPIPKTNYIRIVISKANGATITTDEITDYEFRTFSFE